MLYYVVRGSPHHNTTDSSTQSTISLRSGSVSPPTLMPRYHYSRNLPNSAANNPSNSFLIVNHFDAQTSPKQPTMTAATVTTTVTNPNSTSNTFGTLKSTIIPRGAINRKPELNKREFIQIPVTREDGTSIITNHHQNRSVPINFINETNVLPPTANNNNNNGNTSPRPTFINLLRPTSRYFQYHTNSNNDNNLNSNEEPIGTTSSPLTTTTMMMPSSNVPHLPSVSRRLSLTIPVSTSVTTNTDDNVIKQFNPSSQIRRIPIRLPRPKIASGASTTTLPSTSSTNSRTSSVTLRTSPIFNTLQRQKTEIGEGSLSSPTLTTQTNSSQPSFDFPIPSPIHRAEVMAREAIQGLTRLPQQQQQRHNSLSDINQSPPSSRRLIINLKNNQSISLDSRLSSSMKPPIIPSSLRLSQRNNLYHIPVLHEIQLPSYPTAPTTISENSSALTTSASISNGNNYKNEFHMEIPVTVTTNNNHDQENRRRSSANRNSHQTLKSILKRSSSRETVSRKNMIMSRRKSLHPKSLKNNSRVFSNLNNEEHLHRDLILPNELEYDEESKEIRTRLNLPENYQFGPYPIVLKFEDQKETFHLLDTQFNWLHLISTTFKQISTNLKVHFQNNQLLVLTKEFLPIGTRLSSDEIILPKIKMNIPIKNEPIDNESNKSNIRIYHCENCRICFRNKDTLDAHRHHYCKTYEKQNTHSINSILTKGIKRPAIDEISSIPSKRSFVKFNSVFQPKQLIYVPISLISSSSTDNKPLDLSKPKDNPIFPCQFCSINFRSLKTLQAHQQNYCYEYQKQLEKFSLLKHCQNSNISKCMICSAMFENEDQLFNHINHVHTDKRFIECLQCQSRFSSKWNLIQHMKILHTNIRSNNNSSELFSCSSKYVDKKKKNLTFCSTCQITFQYTDSYQAHKRFYCANERRKTNY